MVKSYLRYDKTSVVGVVTAPRGSVFFDGSSKLAICPTIDGVVVWNWKLGTSVRSFSLNEKGSSVSSLAMSDSGLSLAVGCDTGPVCLYDFRSSECIHTFNGHRGAVTCLRFSSDGALLCSGGRDTYLFVWDVVGGAALCRLKGHTDVVTDTRFIKNGNYVVSCSKDTCIRLWEVETQSCVQTLVGCRHEIWSLDVDCNERMLVAGTLDEEMRVWTNTEDNNEEENESNEGYFSFSGTFKRRGKQRVLCTRFDDTGKYLGVSCADRSVEIFKLKTEREAKIKSKRRRKKSMKSVENSEEKSEILDLKLLPKDMFVSIEHFRAEAKVHSFAFASTLKKDARSRKSERIMLLALGDNRVEILGLDVKNGTNTRISLLETPGHRSDIRSLSMSNDDSMVLSTSNKSIKLWSLGRQECIRTITTRNALCSCFLPGNKYVAIGTKEGDVQLYDISSSTLAHSDSSHGAPVWSICLLPDGSGLISGGADNSVRIWDFEMSENRKISVVESKRVEFKDDVLCCRVTGDSRLLLVSTLDSIVRAFYLDTLKFFLSMYGHKLPVLSMDVSTDNSLLVTASADKNLKIWGLEFGDCHKTILAHEDSVVGVSFVKNTHYVFSCGKDGTVKYWDVDTFELIQIIGRHNGPAWAIGISSEGGIVVSGGKDRSLRFFRRTEEQLFLEEEREKEQEEEFSKEVAADPRKSGVSALPESSDTTRAWMQTAHSLESSERLLESIELADDEKTKVESSATRRQTLMGGRSPLDYVVNAVSALRSEEFESSLSLLPFSHVVSLCNYMYEAISQSTRVEISSRCLVFLVRIHRSQFLASPDLKLFLDKAGDVVPDKVLAQKDNTGFNLAGLERLLKQSMGNRSVIDLTKEKKKKRGRSQDA